MWSKSSSWLEMSPDLRSCQDVLTVTLSAMNIVYVCTVSCTGREKWCSKTPLEKLCSRVLGPRHQDHCVITFYIWPACLCYSLSIFSRSSHWVHLIGQEIILPRSSSPVLFKEAAKWVFPKSSWHGDFGWSYHYLYMKSTETVKIKVVLLFAKNCLVLTTFFCWEPSECF